MPNKSFERFYYERIAISEGCGCAEQFIGTRDLDMRAHETAAQNAPEEDYGSRFAWVGRLFRRWGSSSLQH